MVAKIAKSLGLFVAFLMLQILGVSCTSPLRDGQTIESHDLICTPPSWIEVSRAANPDDKIDAVLLRRTGQPFGDTRNEGTINQVNLYLVPKGVGVKDTPPFPISELSDVLTEERKQAPFMSFWVEKIHLQWRDSDLLTVDAEIAGPSLNQRERETVKLTSKEESVTIDYCITRLPLPSH